MRASRIASFVTVLLLPACVLPVTCTPNRGFVTYSSGTIQDDDVEEPVSAGAKKYEPLLARSNELLQRILDHHLRELYDADLDDALKAQLTEEQLEKMCDAVVAQAGPAQRWKPQQWKFTVGKAMNGSGVDSVKIVHHERVALLYVFTFSDQHATKLIGLHFHQRVLPNPSKL